MKDVPHHMEKFLKDFKMEESPKDNECLKEYKKKPSKKQIKKQKKESLKKEKKEKVSMPDTIEIKNKKMKKRTPVIRKNSHISNTK